MCEIFCAQEIFYALIVETFFSKVKPISWSPCFKNFPIFNKIFFFFANFPIFSYFSQIFFLFANFPIFHKNFSNFHKISLFLTEIPYFSPFSHVQITKFTYFSQNPILSQKPTPPETASQTRNKKRNLRFPTKNRSIQERANSSFYVAGFNNIDAFFVHLLLVSQREVESFRLETQPSKLVAAALYKILWENLVMSFECLEFFGI
jgi:hypothetical protein